jgi:hypothetical protein
MSEAREEPRDAAKPPLLKTVQAWLGGATSGFALFVPARSRKSRLAEGAELTLDPKDQTNAVQPMRDSAHGRRLCLWLITASILVGSLGRIKQYATRPSYWNDEAAVVINVMTRDCRQLLRPLDFAQAAPPLFLWVERGMYRAFGAGEYSLRLPPTILGLAAMPLFALLAWRMLTPASACWAVAWFAMFDKLIRHSIDVKQYSGDVFVAIVLMVIALPDGPGRRELPRRMLMLSIAAAIAVWFSFPAIFLFAGLSLVLLPDCHRAGRSGIITWVGGNALVAVSFGGLWLAALRYGADPSLHDYWADSFPNWPRLPMWLAHHIYGLFGHAFATLSPTSTVLATVLAIFGFIALAKMRRPRLVGLLPVVLASAFIAAALHRYPFPGDHRLGLYLLPIVLLVLAAGAEGRNLDLHGWAYRWWFVMPGALVLLSLCLACKDLVVREQSSAIRPVVQQVRERRKPDEAIYLFGDGLTDGQRPSGRNAEFLCYWPTPPGKVVLGARPGRRISDRRFWIVYSLVRPDKPAGAHVDQLERLMGPTARVIDYVDERAQAGALLFVRE